VQITLLQRLRDQGAAYPPPESLSETKAMWTSIVENDGDLARNLRDTLAGSRTVLEIQVVGENARVLASTNSANIDRQTQRLPALEDWQKLSLWRQLISAFRERSNYEVAIQLGVPGQAAPVFRVKVIISSVLLRNTLRPEVEGLGIAFVISFLASVVLAIVASNIAFRPLARVSRAIDRIARGESFEQPSEAREDSKEVAAIESKLQMLGQQYRGARQDAVALRGNIEQLLERMEKAVLLFDHGDRLIMAGRGTEAILNRGRWELMGRSIEELFSSDTPLGAVVRSAIEFRKSVKDSSVTIERDGQAPARVLVDVELLESFPNRERLGTLVTLRDAETRREIGSQLDISTRLAAISRLTGGVAHEIKNPLNSIALHLEVLRARVADQDAEVDREIDVIATEITRLDRVVKTFLDFTRPVDLHLTEVDAVELAREIGTLVEPEAGKRNIVIEVEAEPGALVVRADHDLLKQAVLNVVMNGIEAMSAGGRLRVEVRRAGVECVIGVSDQGAGIPPEMRDQIFRLYFTTKPAGSGIGLAMTFRVVQLHNGTIDFASEPEKGTTFWLRLPLMEAEAGRG
jgi:hypothetical protein